MSTPSKIRLRVGNGLVEVGELGTTSSGKLFEFSRLGLPLQGVKLETAEYQLSNEQLNILDNGDEEALIKVSTQIAESKARNAAKQHGRSIVVEDSSMYVTGKLARLTGPNIKLWDTDLGRQVLCRVSHAEQCIRALAVVVVAVSDMDGNVATYCGSVRGTISEAPRGSQGFGWDDVFIPEGDTRTYGEMTRQEKDRYSMRERAVRKLIEAIVK